MLLVRTDYADDADWARALETATAVYPSDDFDRTGAAFVPVESPEPDGPTTERLRALPRNGYLSAIAVADTRTMLITRFFS